MITKAVLITMSVAGAYMILVIGLMVWCRYRRKARKLAANAEGNYILALNKSVELQRVLFIGYIFNIWCSVRWEVTIS